MRALERRLRAAEGLQRVLAAKCATVLTRPGAHATAADIETFNTQLATARERGGPLVILTLNHDESPFENMHQFKNRRRNFRRRKDH
jgi:hypothetical protein